MFHISLFFLISLLSFMCDDEVSNAEIQMLKNCIFCFISVPDDLSMEEREELLNIRRRKKELIDDIEVIDLL